MALTITVSTQTELINALKTASGGETILLKGGNYGQLTLIDTSSFDLTFPKTVTIAAANPDNPPVVTGLDVRCASNLSFEGITFDYTAKSSAAVWTLPFRVQGGNDISFDGCRFDGDNASGLKNTDNGFPTGQGLALGGIQGVSVTNCEFSNFYKGLSVGGSNGVVVAGNDIHDIRMDGMTFSSVQGVLIEDNRLHDFRTSPQSADHSDMIQFWTTGTSRPSTDIIIRGNTLDIGEGGLTQSIFMRNELVDTGAAGREMYYRNVLIEDNVIVNGHLHGITVGETDGLTITRNAVLHADGNLPDGNDTTVEIPRINVAPRSTGVSITQNATSGIVGHSGQADWVVRMNAFVQDQDANAPGWYGDVFVTSSLTMQDGAHVFLARPGSMLATLSAGAPAILERPADVLDAAFIVTGHNDDLHSMTFDASVSAGVLPAGTTYLWTFGDGTTATGRTVTHSFVDGGRYDVTLTVKLPDGRSDQVLARLAVENPLVVRLGDAGGFITSSAGTETLVSAAMPLDAAGNLQLGGPATVARIAHSSLERMFGADDVRIDFRLRTDAPGNSGEVFRLHGGLQATVTTAGEIQVRVWSSDGGAVTVVSTGVAINDGKFHDVRVDIEDGRLVLAVDQVKLQKVPFSGSILDPGSYDLTFGSGWAAQNLQGDLDRFQISVGDGTPVRTQPVSHTLSADAAPAAEALSLPPQREALLRLQDSGDFSVYRYGTATTVDVADAVLSDGNLQLSGARRSVAAVDDALIDCLFDNDDVQVGFRIAADSAGETGEVFRINGSLLASVTSRGEVQVKVYAQDGSATVLTSTGMRVNDGVFHDIDIRLADGRLSLWLDDRIVQEAEFRGTIADAGNYDLTFGTSWAADTFAGDLDSFDISLGVDPLTALAVLAEAPLV